jgi:hypothetical protein
MTGIAEADSLAARITLPWLGARRIAWLLTPDGVLALTATAYAAACVAMIPLNMAMNWDQIVYTSQLDADQVPMPVGWSPGVGFRGVDGAGCPADEVRRGAPRAYLVVVAGLAMFVALLAVDPAFGPHRPTRYVAAFAAAIFGAQWLTVLNGPMGFPNLWLAFALIARVGFVLKSVLRPAATGPWVATLVSFTAAAFAAADGRHRGRDAHSSDAYGSALAGPEGCGCGGRGAGARHRSPRSAASRGSGVRVGANVPVRVTGPR